MEIANAFCKVLCFECGVDALKCFASDHEVLLSFRLKRDRQCEKMIRTNLVIREPPKTPCSNDRGAKSGIRDF